MRSIVILLAVLMLAAGCAKSDEMYRTVGTDGNLPDGALLEYVPTRCAPRGGHSLAVGPERGCVSMTVVGQGEAEPGHWQTTRDTPVRMFRGGTGSAHIRVRALCDESRGPFVLFVALPGEQCDVGRLVYGVEQASCDALDPLVLPYDEWAFDGNVEASVAGAGAFEFTFCLD